MALFRFFILCLCLVSCSSRSNQGYLKVGIDPYWYPNDFGPQTSYVNGYVENILLEVSKYSGMEFEVIQANWDDILDNLEKGKYDCIISTLPLHEFYLARYDFSESFLKLGPTLIVSTGSKDKNLDQLEGELVGIIQDDPAELILAKHPKIIVRTYKNIPDLLNAVTIGEIQGALVDWIPAVNFVGGIYHDVLKIVDGPFGDEGIHLIGLKGKIDRFNHQFKALKDRSTISKLQEKWELSIAF